MSGWHKTWITTALDNVQAKKALTLVRSLKASMTSKKTGVVVGPGVTRDQRTELETEFDACFIRTLEPVRLPPGISLEMYLQLSCLTVMPFITTAIYIHPNSMVLGNVDDLFETLEFGVKSVPGSEGIALAKFEPSNDRFMNVMQDWKNGKATNGHLGFDGNKIHVQVGFVSSKSLCNERDLDAAKILYFMEQHPTEVEDLGMLPLPKETLAMFEAYKSPQPFLLKGNGNEPIAVIGMACRFAKSNSPSEYWNLVVGKEIAITSVPEFRWLPEHFPNQTKEHRSTKAGFLQYQVESGDPKFFNQSPMEFQVADPQQRILLEVAWEALEDAGINPHSLRGSHTSIFTGAWTTDYKDTITSRMGEEDAELGFRIYMGNSFGSISGKLSHFLGTTGPNIATESGCSSSMVAVGMGMKSLRLGESDLALACGVNLLMRPFVYKMMEAVLSPTGQSRSFDADADGFARGEGCGVLVLKRLSDAVREGDKVYGLLRGYGEAQEGTSSSMGTPTVDVEALAMSLALKDAGLQGKDITYVEAHATGTQIGDAVEMKAIKEVYASQRKKPLYVTSVKPNVGHTESASGIAGIIKVLKAFEHGVIPPHAGCDKINPALELDKIPAAIPFEKTEWTKEDGIPRIAGVSAFGITGTDAHIIVQEPPPMLGKEQVPSEFNIVTISAKTEDALDTLLTKYQEHLSSQVSTLGDVAFTANVGRAHFSNRIAIIAKNKTDLVKKLEKGNVIRGHVSPDPKLCFLFAGQGAQYNEMGKVLYAQFNVFKDALDKCFDIANGFGLKLKPAMWEGGDGLDDAVNSQISIFIMEYATLKLWESFGIKPDVVLGHSMGEFAAATAAGIFSLEDAMKLLILRHLNSRVPSGSMLCVQSDQDSARNLIKLAEKENGPLFWIDVACVNSSTQIVVGGLEESIDKFAQLCENNKVKTIKLKSSRAYHTRLMENMVPEFKKLLQSTKINQPKCAYISATNGNVLQAEDICPDYWLKNLLQPVQFMKATESLQALFPNCLCIEVSPHPVLGGLVASNVSSIPVHPSIRKGENELQTLLQSLGSLYVSGVTPEFNGVHKSLPGRKVSLPHYPFGRKPYWFQIRGNKALEGKAIHPLLGCVVSNPTSNKMFRSLVYLKGEPYLEDHKVGKYIIFPGAGYLEMFTAASHSLILNTEDLNIPPSAPVTVKDLRIKSPLDLTDAVDAPCELQTVVFPPEDDENGSMTATVYEKKGKWMAHASAKLAFGYQAESYPKFVLPKEGEVDVADVFYDKIAAVGLNFGPIFKSIHKMWINGETVTTEISAPPKLETYLIHPVILDAMLQTLLVTHVTKTAMGAFDKLFLPVSIKSFTWHCQGVPKYVQAFFDEDTKEEVAVLYNEHGALIAVMKGAEIIETEMSSISRALESYRLKLPPIFEEDWVPDSLWDSNGWVSNDKETMNELCNVVGVGVNLETESSPEAIKAWKQANEEYYKATTMFIIKAMEKLGWGYKVGDIIKVDEAMSLFQIPLKNRLIFRGFCRMLGEDGYLQGTDSPFEFKVKKPFPSKEERLTSISKAMDNQQLKLEMQVLHGCMEKLPGVLQGTDNALSVIFSTEDDSRAERLYTESMGSIELNKQIQRVVESLLEKKWNSEGSEFLKILEIGAGTGSATSIILPLLESQGVQYSYTFTDLSTMFFRKAEKRFPSYEKKMIYKILNVEQDPMTQGFAPFEYDFVVCSNVIHATKDLKESLRNLGILMKPGAILLLAEIFGPLRGADCTFGLLEGWWRFQDFELREFHPLIGEEKWEKVLTECGFEFAKALPIKHLPEVNAGVVLGMKDQDNVPVPYLLPSEGRKVWLLFGRSDSQFVSQLSKKLRQCGREAITISFSEGGIPGKNEIPANSEEAFHTLLHCYDETPGSIIEGVAYLWGTEDDHLPQNRIGQGFLNLIKALISSKFPFAVPRLIVPTTGVIYAEDEEPKDPSASTIWGMVKAVSLEYPSLQVRAVDLQSDSPVDVQVTQILKELWRDDINQISIYRERHRLHPMARPIRFTSTPLDLPETQRYALVLPSTKTIADLRFVPDKGVELPPSVVEVQVKACALNFRDVFAVLKPSEQFTNVNAIGSDFSGVVTSIGSQVSKWRVGDPVIGCSFENRALPSHIRMFEDGLTQLPQGFTFEDGCTLPVVFVTAYHSLIDVGKIQRGERILVHTASGGVGIIAIQIAKRLGVDVIATAGSKRKRAFLREIMGVKHVFHSRDLSFKDGVKTATNGVGVDLVLNSITGPGFKEASLSLLKKGGRFIEMSKLNVWGEQDVQALRPDVFYKIVDLSSASKPIWTHLFKEFDTWLKMGRIQPIPFTRFDFVHIREALTYLQKARHIGKVVVVPPIRNLEETESQLFSDRSSYLITGGLGGIGLEVGKWMVSRGAKYLVLMGRNPPSQTASATIQNLEEKQGAVITVVQGDVGIRQDCLRVLEQVKDTLPPLRGIMHVAGTLSDAILQNQSWDKYETCLKAKVHGSWNLHELTLSQNLEYFVFFSSSSAVIGSIGQSNHVSANNFMDSLAHYRHNLGLSALSVNWGQWGEVGVAADIKLFGIEPFTPLQGITALESLLKEHRVQAAVLDADFANFRTTSQWLKNYCEKLVKSEVGAGIKKMGKLDISGDKFWADYDSKGDAEEQAQVVQDALVKIVSHILRLDSDERLDVNQPLKDIGFDSLMMIEMKNILQETFGSRVTFSISHFQDCNTLSLLANRLHSIIEGKFDEEQKESVDTLVATDSILAPEIKPPNAGTKLSNITDILLTGATGHLGSHLLKYLSKMEQIKRIYCLVRCNNEDEGKSKLEQVLGSKGIEDVDLSKVIILPGSVDKDHLGLEYYTYTTLAESIQAVFNCSVASNHVELYSHSSSSRHVNVIGTLNLIRFATCTNTKAFYQASTFVYMGATKSHLDHLPESWPVFEHGKDVIKMKSGYGISKHVGDVLLSQASERGLPVKLFRFGLLGGDSKRGNVPIQNNHVYLRYLSYFQLGCVPCLPIPINLIPVDVAASISCQVFFNPLGENGVYNFTNPKNGWETDIVQIAKEFGYSMEIVGLETYVEKAKGLGTVSHISSFTELYDDEDLKEKVFFGSNYANLMKNPDKFQYSEKLGKLLKSEYHGIEEPLDTLRRDLEFALPKVGMNV